MSAGRVKLEVVTHSGVTVGTGSTAILAANPRRLYAEIINSSDEGVWIKLGGTAVVGEGIYIAPGGFSYEIKYNENLFLGAINGICNSGSKIVGTVEGQ